MTVHDPLRTLHPLWKGRVMAIVLDGQDWETEGDFIEAVLAGVEAPAWHGRNYNALRDSFVTGSINGFEPPYDFIIRLPRRPTLEVADAIAYFTARVSDWRAEGALLSVSVVEGSRAG